ncbi:MAG: M36 family metallopeptidase [Bacteroidota bacterium]
MKTPVLLLLLSVLGSTTAWGQINHKNVEDYLQTHFYDFQLSSNDIHDWVITDQYTSSLSGITHVYLRQRYEGIEIQDALLHLHFDNGGKVLHSGSSFIGNIAKVLTPQRPRIDAPTAVQAAAHALDYHPQRRALQTKTSLGNAQQSIVQLDEFSQTDIPVKLMYQRDEAGNFHLVWDMAVQEQKNGFWWGLQVDAQTGELIGKDAWTLTCEFGHAHGKAHDCSGGHAPKLPGLPERAPFFMTGGTYNVFAMPAESPSHGSRSLVVDPADSLASPFDWHDTDGVVGVESTQTIGNNVWAQLDLNDTDGNTGQTAEGGASLNFDFPFDPADEPSDYRPAVLTNLFYWNNVIHDVLYHYGFDEAGGNFQENNYGRGGAESDFVWADAQDGSGTNNANFGTPPDGSNPRMQMYVWTNANPDRDSDFDNGVIAHEYGHGVSNRLTAGPSNVRCLGNEEQMGEGWSDYLGLILTMEAGDTSTDRRGIGTYVLNQSPTADGIRRHPYTTDMTINPHTYDDIRTESRPHGIGSVWCAMLWEMTWSLVDLYGFDADFYRGTGGNNRALALVMEGMRLQPCSPGFVDGRDAILAADRYLYDGAHQCLIWEAFAKRGLGFSASQGESDSRSDGIEAFDLPPSCTIAVSLSGPSSATQGSEVEYTVTVENVSNQTVNDVAISALIPDSTTYVMGTASDGGTLVSDLIEWPLVSMASGATLSRTYRVSVSTTIPEPGTFTDDLEGNTDYWLPYATNPNRSEWILTDPADTPDRGLVWFASDPNAYNDQYLTFDRAFRISSTSELVLEHEYDTEFTWDGGKVFISTNNGGNWVDLGTRMTQNAYNSTINNNSTSPAFSGSSGGYVETRVNLTDFAGELALFRFWLHADIAVGANGWYLSELELTDINFALDNRATAAFGGQEVKARIPLPTVISNQAPVPLELGPLTGRALETANLLAWSSFSEQNVSHFEVQRSANGFSDWDNIGRVEAVGFSAATQNYEWLDKTPLDVAYYRLWIVDFDGQERFSEVIQVRRATKSFSDLALYPNPFRERVELSFQHATGGQLDLEVRDVYGIQQLQWRTEMARGAQTQVVDLSGLAAGCYVLILSDGERRETLRIIKQ